MTRDVTEVLATLVIPDPVAIDEGSLAAGLGLGEMAVVAELVGLESRGRDRRTRGAYRSRSGSASARR